jgi:hypothetical protein
MMPFTSSGALIDCSPLRKNYVPDTRRLLFFKNHTQHGKTRPRNSRTQGRMKFNLPTGQVAISPTRYISDRKQVSKVKSINQEASPEPATAKVIKTEKTTQGSF